MPEHPPPETPTGSPTPEDAEVEGDEPTVVTDGGDPDDKPIDYRTYVWVRVIPTGTLYVVVASHSTLPADGSRPRSQCWKPEDTRVLDTANYIKYQDDYYHPYVCTQEQAFNVAVHPDLLQAWLELQQKEGAERVGHYRFINRVLDNERASRRAARSEQTGRDAALFSPPPRPRWQADAARRYADDDPRAPAREWIPDTASITAIVNKLDTMNKRAPGKPPKLPGGRRESAADTAPVAKKRAAAGATTQNATKRPAATKTPVKRVAIASELARQPKPATRRKK
ncbi:hypothetical protein P7C70_g9011, partial [Phenoliferia sp. Uapishka_3]